MDENFVTSFLGCVLWKSQSYKVFSAVRLQVPQVQLLPDDVVEDDGVDGEPEDKAEDGEDNAGNEHGHTKFVRPLHP